MPNGKAEREARRQAKARSDVASILAEMDAPQADPNERYRPPHRRHDFPIMFADICPLCASEADPSHTIDLT
jgi:hypothetical protein